MKRRISLFLVITLSIVFVFTLCGCGSTGTSSTSSTSSTSYAKSPEEDLLEQICSGTGRWEHIFDLEQYHIESYYHFYENGGYHLTETRDGKTINSEAGEIFLDGFNVTFCPYSGSEYEGEFLDAGNLHANGQIYTKSAH